MAYQHVIFDFDGVIADSARVAAEEFNRIADEHFPHLPHIATQEDFSIVYCGPLATSLRRFGLSDAQCRKFFDLHSRRMAARSSEIRTFDGVLRAIKMFAVGRSSIVSSCYGDAIERILNESSEYEPSIFLHVLGR